MAKMLTPLKQNIKYKKFIGFDCETYSNKNKFQCMAFYESEDRQLFYTDRNKFFELCEVGYFKNKIIVATMLSFDFNVLFDRFYVKEFNLLYRGTRLLKAVTYYHSSWKRIIHEAWYFDIKGKILNKIKFSKNKKDRLKYLAKYKSFCRTVYKIEFIDTMCFSPFGVAKLGKIIGVPKLECPFEYGYKCKNETEFNLMKTYNMNDAKISKLFMDYFQNATIELGGNLKTTISSSSVYLFRCKYLKDKFFCQPVEVMNKIFNAYYGGRTEAFFHGKFKGKYNMYDINSLYPSVMLNEYPNPNTTRVTRKTNIELIKKYDGVSLVTVNCPLNINIPLLPYKTATKLYFPTGTFKGWYSHIELRRALEIGYTIMNIEETIYYEKNIRPFSEYVNDLYEKRMKYKEEDNPMEEAVKLYLNSFYGKLGERYQKKENIISKKYFKYKDGMSVEEYDKDFLRVVCDIKPKNHTFPIWAVYVTAYARLKLYDYMSNYNVLYCDTDSIITADTVETSSKLGDMKKEKINICEGYIIRPKFYALKDDKDFKEDKIKIKGLPLHYTYEQFEYLLKNNTVVYNKFIQFKEGLKRELDINEIIQVSKMFKCVDNKRNFQSQEIDKLYSSKPYDVSEIKEKNILYSDKDDFTYTIGFD
jgi:hypothetical protein